ncbi:MAG: hypothetical protein BWY77_01039 [bacterium ADurb.Bin431]|nr:MAG: hypothetical protein BWY77_01039 [bacterium ADurb.Bin431]
MHEIKECIPLVQQGLPCDLSGGGLQQEGGEAQALDPGAENEGGVLRSMSAGRDLVKAGEGLAGFAEHPVGNGQMEAGVEEE